MSFRNRIVRISQLVFDKLATGVSPAARIEIETTGANANKISLYTGISEEFKPAQIYVAGTDPTPNSKYQAELDMNGPMFPQPIPGQVGKYVYPPTLNLKGTVDLTLGQPVWGSVANLSADRITLQAVGKANGASLNGIAFNGVEQCYSGTEGGLIGAAPQVGQPKLIKQDTVAVFVTGGTGDVQFDYASGAFPNGIVSVVATPGDDLGNFNAVRMVPAGCTLGHYYGRAITNTGYVASGQAIRINYIAFGW